MRAYVINMDRSVERMRRMDHMLRKLDLAYVRVPAVDAASFAYSGSLQLPQLSNFLSHQRCWKLISESREPGIVLEDDVVFAANFDALLRDPKLVPPGVDLVRLEACPWKAVVTLARRKVNEGYALHRLAGTTVGAAAYIVTDRFAAWLVENVRIENTLADLVLFGNEMIGQRDIRTVVPGPCIQYHCLKQLPPNPEVVQSTLDFSVASPPTRVSKTLAFRLRSEFGREARRLRRLLRGEMEISIGLHRAGPLPEQ